MTIRLHKPVARVVETDRYGPLVVTLTAEGLVLRQKGRRTRYLLPYGYAYVRGATLAAQAIVASKPARKKVRRSLNLRGR